MKEESLMILEMLQNGTITVNEAEKLLSALSSKPVSDAKPISVDSSDGKRKRKMLRILVNSGDGDNVNIQIPVEFAKLLKSSRISNKLSIDETNIDINEVIKLAEDGIEGDLIDIKSKNGETVKIFIE